MQFRRFIPRLRLHGLNTDAVYRVNSGKGVSERALMQIGIEIVLTSDWDIVLLNIKQQSMENGEKI